MFLLPAAAVVTALLAAVGLSLWLRRHLDDGTPPRWAQSFGISSPRLLRVLAVFDGLRALSLVAIPAVALLFLASVDLTVSRLSIRQEGHRGSRPGLVGLPLTGATTTAPAATAPTPTPDTTTAPGAPTTTLPCRNSTDPACGPFRWDPAPAPNQPVAIEIAHSPSAPQVGEQVTVTVHVAETDSKIDGITVSFGDEEALTLPPASVVACDDPEPTGPWSPPDATGVDTVSTYGHTYTRAGDFTIDVYAASADFLEATCPPNPYASQGAASTPIHVG